MWVPWRPEALDPLELVAAGCEPSSLYAGNQTEVLLKNSMCFYHWAISLQPHRKLV